MSDRPADDPIQRPFWDGARAGELRIQACRSCGHRQLYGRRTCGACRSRDLTWRASRGLARVYSLTRVHGYGREPSAPPYVVALVDLDEGPRLMTRLVNGECAIGDRVKVCWHPRESGPPLPCFEPI